MNYVENNEFSKKKRSRKKDVCRYSSKSLNKSVHFAGSLDNKHVLNINIPFIQYRICTHIHL